ncbi:MAG: glucose-phosphate thymidylyltransferase [Pseudomonadota bacterium]|jgi:glucose-1-phosphate thymidylyltransferase
MKGIILAGGTASRLAPTSFVVNKHILPIYNKPLVFYPLATLMLLGVRDFLITLHEHDLENFEKLLGDGSDLGIRIQYKIQERAGGIAEVLLLADDFIKEGERFAMVLGDNIYYIPHIRENLASLLNIKNGAGVVLSNVNDPHRFGIAEFDNDNNLVGVEEKPKNPKSNFAITGLYFYDRQAIEFAKNATRSARGELEVTDVNEKYLKQGQLNYIKLPRGSVWLDAGTPKSMFEASEFVKIIEEKQGYKIAVLEEVAYNMGYINNSQLEKIAAKYKSGCEYGDYIKSLINGK